MTKKLELCIFQNSEMAILCCKSGSLCKKSRVFFMSLKQNKIWFLIFFFSCFTIISSNTSAIEISYRQHCSSIIPESVSTGEDLDPLNFLIFDRVCFTGGEPILGRYNHSSYHDFRRSVLFVTNALSRTRSEGVLKVVGFLYIRGSYWGTGNFLMEGFWAESSEKLCMVGSGSGYSSKGNLVDLSAVFKLSYPKKSTIVNSFVTGSLESIENLDSQNHFKPISILAFFQKTYEYTLISEYNKTIFSSVSNPWPEAGSLSVDKIVLCSRLSLSYKAFQLEFAGNCRVKNCSPLDSLGFLPTVMFIDEIKCSAEGKLLFLLHFSANTSYESNRVLVPEATLVGEGMWDEEKNELRMVVCRLLDFRVTLEKTTVGDCNIGLSLRFPAVLSLRNRNGVVGQIWSNKNENDSGYFERFLFRSDIEQNLQDSPGLKYNYTQIYFKNRSCGSGFLGWKVIEKLAWGGRRYPDVFSSMDMYMSFYMSVENSLGEKTWGHSTPLSIGESFYGRSRSNPANPVIHEQDSSQNLFNVSYIIKIYPSFNFKWGGLLTDNLPLEISAEGVYDADNGILCMVGCFYVSSNNNSFSESVQQSMDCDILIKIQFPPQNPKWYETKHTVGTITSTRAKSDPFYIEPLTFSSDQNIELLWGIKVDTNMLLIFLTLASVVIGLQLYYVKNHPDGLPSISLPMLVFLIVGYLVPLIFYFEAFFLDKFWPEYAVVMRAVTMVAFLLQFCVLQSIWPARSVEGHRRKIVWALNVCLPLFLVGVLIAFYVHWQVPALKDSQNPFGEVLVASEFEFDEPYNSSL